MNIEDYIASGILEKFVFGRLSEDECKEILVLAEEHPAIQEEIQSIEESMELVARAYAVAPPAKLKQSIFDAIDNAETPPPLSANSVVSDYSYWLNKFDPPAEYENLHMEVIAQDDASTMVIAWIKNGEEDHLHTDYTEIFLIAEGTCRATIDGVTADYGPGDYVEFTIDKHHSYSITSPHPMKVVAALVNRAA